MHELRIGALPVVNEKAQQVGILSESDIFRLLIAWFNEENGETE
jgi:CBS domain-containing protein